LSLATGEAWPSWEASASELEVALEQLVATDPPAQDAWPVRLMGDAIGGAAVMAQELAALTGAVHEARQGDTRPPVARLKERVEGTAVERPARRAVQKLRGAKRRLAG
jgi:hypothetical protein